ncbi:hypothetical protein CASFOL_000394 [Castilleja foliolosa]|uniref:Uncharacterized protein n=1 Tax=Castilleja foliolosa TaxID=1961234 RepID=A0ABD3ENS7_9LAMI
MGETVIPTPNKSILSPRKSEADVSKRQASLPIPDFSSLTYSKNLTKIRLHLYLHYFHPNIKSRPQIVDGNPRSIFLLGRFISAFINSTVPESMNKELVRVKREVGETMARKVVIEENKLENRISPKKGLSLRRCWLMLKQMSKVVTDMTGDEVVQDDEGTVKVTKNMVDDPPEKAGEKACAGEGERSTCISNVDEQPKKAPLKKPSVSKKAAKGILIQEPEVERVKTRGANSNAGAIEKGKAVIVTDKIVDGGKRRKPDATKPKALTPKRTKSVLGECSSKKQRMDDVDIDIYPSLKTRNSWYTLIKFNITETPSTLGYWLLENFDPMACVVKLQEGRELRVEADDVTHVLWIPNGDTIIKRFAKNIPHPVVTQWKALFSDHLKSITAAHVADKMLSKETNTVWFKRLFLILITTCLVESCENGYVITRIIPNFEDPDQAKKLNWGEYMKKCLAEEVVRWNKKNRKDPFTGPLVFLMALYVDRVDLMDRLVRRVYPFVKGWTCTLFRQREKFEILAGGFSRGYPVDRARREVNEDLSRSKNRPPSAVDANVPDRDEGEFKTSASQSAYSFAEALLRKSKLVAETMSDIIEMVQSGPININENANLKKVVDDTERFLGCKLERPEVAKVTADAADPLSTWENEDFWSDPEIIALMDGIAKGVGKVDELASGLGRREELRAMAFDSPTFSLGMTQYYPGGVVQGKNDEAVPAKTTEQTKGERTKVTVAKDVDPKGKGKMKDFVEIPSKRVTRNAASKKKSISGCSPYKLRATKVGDSLNKDEKELCYWVMNNDELCMT